MQANRIVSLIVAMAVAAASSIAMAQNAAAPARETPRPQDVDPAVNTSATPARETPPPREAPRPQDIEPRVNTSAPSQSPSPQLPSPSSAPSEAAPGEASSAATGAAARGSAPSSARPSASGARNSGAPGTSGATGAARAANADAATSGTAQAAGKTGAKGKALDRLELDTTQITGNRELPKVLYIVPWKRSDLGDLVGKPVNSLLDEVLTPVDRDVFQRENRYYRALTPGAVENDALSAPDGRAPTPVRSPVPTNSAPAAGSQGSAAHPVNPPVGGVSTGSGSATPPPRDEK
jgi:hypothetical protein